MKENYILKQYAPETQKKDQAKIEQLNMDIEIFQTEMELKDKEIDRLNLQLKDPNWVICDAQT